MPKMLCDLVGKTFLFLVDGNPLKRDDLNSNFKTVFVIIKQFCNQIIKLKWLISFIKGRILEEPEFDFYVAQFLDKTLLTSRSRSEQIGSPSSRNKRVKKNLTTETYIPNLQLRPILNSNYFWKRTMKQQNHMRG
jgi:hypothetical protein